MGGLDALLAGLSGMELYRDVPMRGLTSFGLGGPADAVLYPHDEQQVLHAIVAARQTEVPAYIMGNGSNLLVRDGGIRGLVILLGSHMAGVSIEGTQVRAGAGISLTQLCQEALRAGLQGLEWACGIPGTLGGACAMNAGAYDGCMQQVLLRIRYIEQGALLEREVLPGELSYRESAFCAPQRVVVSAALQLEQDDGNAANRQKEFIRRRREKQPLAEKSAGSTFKRPPGHFAAALIDKAGLKGTRRGGAVVSPLHAGFIINEGTATANDVLRLIEYVQQQVLKQFGVMLCCEPKIWGVDAVSPS